MEIRKAASPPTMNTTTTSTVISHSTLDLRLWNRPFPPSSPLAIALTPFKNNRRP